MAEAGAAVEQLKNPSLTNEQRTQIERQKEAAVQKVEAVAESRPDDAAVQLKVGRGLASVEEAPRAISYAERGLALAETSGDPRLVREALLTGSEVYAKAGRYDLARERAERVLKQDPRDKDALALFMQVKGRGAASSASPAGGAAAGAAGSAGPASGAAAAAPVPPRAVVAAGAPMTSPASLEARKHIALGWSRLALDPPAALKSFEAAITADPLSAAVRVERSKARLSAGDAPGALGDAEDAVRMEPRLGDAYAARAEAKRALGRAEAELLSDYETASGLDGRFTQAYKAIAARLASSAGAQADGSNTDAGPAPDGARGWRALPEKRGLTALVLVLAAAAGGLLVVALLKRRR